MKLESLHYQRKELTDKDMYPFAPSAQGGEESPESADKLQLNEKQQKKKNDSLNWQGHKEASHPRLRHREVVCLVCDV